jgi:hypothetical protein
MERQQSHVQTTLDDLRRQGEEWVRQMRRAGESLSPSKERNSVSRR